MAQTRSSKTEDITIINNKLDSILNKLEILTTTFHELSQSFISSSKSNLKSDVDNLQSALTQEIRNISNTVQRNMVKEKSPNFQLSKRLNQRKFNYYEAIRNKGIANIYSEALNDAIPKIPKKFFRNSLPHLSALDNDFRKELSLKEVEHEIQKLLMTSAAKMNFVERVDNEVYAYFNNFYSDQEAQTHILKWQETIKKEETLSENIWERKCKFFESQNHLLPLDSNSKSSNRRTNNQRFNNNRNRLYRQTDNYVNNTYNKPALRNTRPNNYNSYRNFDSKNRINNYFNSNRRGYYRNFGRNNYRNYNRNNFENEDWRETVVASNPDENFSNFSFLDERNLQS